MRFLLNYDPLPSTVNAPSSPDWSNETTRLAVIEQRCPEHCFLGSQSRSSRQGARRGRERKASRPFWQAERRRVEGTRFIWLFQSRRQVTWQPRCIETFFVWAQLWEVNKVVYPVFGNRVRCTAWQPLQCFLVPPALLPTAWQLALYSHKQAYRADESQERLLSLYLISKYFVVDFISVRILVSFWEHSWRVG